MHWKETGGVEKLFALPGRHIPSRVVAKNYQNHLTSRPVENDDGEEEPPALGPPEHLPVMEAPASTTRSGRKRKLDPPPELEPVASTPITRHQVQQQQRTSIQQVVEDESSFFKQAGIDTSMMENMGYDGGDLNLAGGDLLGGANTPWGNEDYDFPASVGQQSDHQLDEETYEEYEERVLTRRAAQMHHIIKSKIDQGLTFGAMCNARNTRKQVAQKFYTLLVLKKAHTIEMIQDGSYEEIRVEKGPKFGVDTVGL